MASNSDGSGIVTTSDVNTVHSVDASTIFANVVTHTVNSGDANTVSEHVVTDMTFRFATKSSTDTNDECSLFVTDINNVLPSLFGKDQPTLSEYASYNISLSAHIPDKPKQNIWNNKFIEMELLLPGAEKPSLST